MRRKRQTWNESVSLTSMTKFFDYLTSIKPINDITPATLALDYLYNHAGTRYVSPLVDHMLSYQVPVGNIPVVLSDSDILALSGQARDMYADKWNRLWDALRVEYGLLDNTDAHVTQSTTTERSGSDGEVSKYGKTTEHVKHEESGRADTTTYGKITENVKDLTKTTENTTNHGETVTTNNDNTNTQSVTAFNISDMTPQSENITNGDSTETHGGSDTISESVKNTGTDKMTDGGTDKLQSDLTGDATDNITDGGQDERNSQHEETVKVTYEETRKGNIGVTTAQQMLTQEFDMRAKFNMQDFIYADLDKLLTIPKFKTDC